MPDVRRAVTKLVATGFALAAVSLGLARGALPPAAAPGAASGLASITAGPDLRAMGRLPASGKDITTAQCQARFRINCYTPGQIQQAYNLDSLYGRNVTGKGSTIVVVDAYGSPPVDRDLASFDADAGLPDSSLTILQPLGAVPAFDLSNPIMVDWAGETTLDVEWAHAVAPGAKIVLVEVPSQGVVAYIDAVQYAVSHRLGDVISLSYDVSEPYLTSYYAHGLDGVFAQAAGEHITVVAATGDSGATAYQPSGGYYSYPAVNWPASDPYVTAVGGTALNLDYTGSRI